MTLIDQADAASVRWVFDHCRPRDRLELDAVGKFEDLREIAIAGLPGAIMAITARNLLAPPAVFLSFYALTASALSAAMIVTPDWPSVALSFVRYGLDHVRPLLLAKGFKRAECRAIEGHADATRMLEALGFKHECAVPDFGRHGETFHQFAWRLSDHVLSAKDQHSEAAAAAAARGRERGGRG